MLGRDILFKELKKGLLNNPRILALIRKNKKSQGSPKHNGNEEDFIWSCNLRKVVRSQNTLGRESDYLEGEI